MYTNVMNSITRKPVGLWLAGLFIAILVLIGHAMPVSAQTSGSSLPSPVIFSYDPLRVVDPTDIGEPVEKADVTYIVRFAPESAAHTQAVGLASADGQSKNSLTQLNMEVVELPANAHIERAAVLVRNPNVISVEPNHERSIADAPSDTEYTQQWSLPRIDWDLVL